MTGQNNDEQFPEKIAGSRNRLHAPYGYAADQPYQGRGRVYQLRQVAKDRIVRVAGAQRACRLGLYNRS